MLYQTTNQIGKTSLSLQSIKAEKSTQSFGMIHICYNFCKVLCKILGWVFENHRYQKDVYWINGQIAKQTWGKSIGPTMEIKQAK